MTMVIRAPQLVVSLWLAWMIAWWIWSHRAKPVRRRESRMSRATHVIPLALAAFLLAAPRLPVGVPDPRLVEPHESIRWIGVALVAAGLAFAVWARAYLGGNWSGVVTLKEGHELIRSGPYRYVRHPIYSGLLLVLLGTAVTQDKWRGLLALALAFGALWRKLNLEERWLIEAFGENYQRYRREVAALVPFLR